MKAAMNGDAKSIAGARGGKGATKGTRSSRRSMRTRDLTIEHNRSHFTGVEDGHRTLVSSNEYDSRHEVKVPDAAFSVRPDMQSLSELGVVTTRINSDATIALKDGQEEDVNESDNHPCIGAEKEPNGDEIREESTSPKEAPDATTIT
jgi:hypothetical protein